MSLCAGDRLGPYQITDSIGMGGMGEVYRAHDSRLGRDVAIKVSAQQFEERFEREARAIAALNHANICTLHDVGPNYLVMELVEGQTLSEKIQLASGFGRGLPLSEALGLSLQIAAALETAHEKGILHRDLKPANIKVTPAGVVKVLDFGLAKIQAPGADAASLANSPTLTEVSVSGVILGTAAFMSPEQATGQPVDRSSDVWAFGCVLFEMLTGVRAFSGRTVSEILADVLRGEPDWSRLPADTPASIHRLLRRCLRKDRKQRLHDMGDVALEISDAIDEPAADASRRPVAPRRERLAWASALILALIGAAVMGIRAFRETPPPEEMRLEITTPPTTDPVSIAISPDGRYVVFVALSDGRPRLWLRSLNAASAVPLQGTDRAALPFWSPTSRSVAFFADGFLKRIDVPGGAPQVIAGASRGYPGAWLADNTILFAPSGLSPIVRVPSSGGTPTNVTALGSHHIGHRFPQLLPDGRHFLYFVMGDADVRGIYIGQLDGDKKEGDKSAADPRLLVADAAVLSPAGYLLFVRQGTLMAQRFDPAHFTLEGEPFSLAEQLAEDNFLNFPALSASAAGPFIYRTGPSGGRRQLAWFDRSGALVANLGEPDPGQPLNPSLARDGRRVVLNRSVDGNTDIWTVDVRGAADKFTTNPLLDNFPVWSPDGKRIVFGSNRNGTFDLYQKLVDGGGEDVLLRSPEIKNPCDWSADGRFLLYRKVLPNGGDDLWALPMDGDPTPFPVTQSASAEAAGQFSPNGRWVAYESNESGEFEVYVQPFPHPGGKIRVSIGGGAQVRWRGDGKELFYIAADGRLNAVSVRESADLSAIELSAPAPLFMTRVGGFRQGINFQQYAVDADGKRFLMNTILEEPASPITVMLNWNPKAR